MLVRTRSGSIVPVAIGGTVTAYQLTADVLPLDTIAVLAFSTAAGMHTRLALGRWQAAAQILGAGAALAAIGAAPRLVGSLFVTGLTAAELVARCARRSDVVRVGVWTGVMAAAAVASGLVVARALPADALARETFAAAIGGFLGASVLLTFGPLAEWLFGHMTRLTMSEWLSYEHPLLRDLASKAPGTFQHSINVGVMADAGARALEADALLARVGGLYHDVGKLRAPEFFSENQRGRNPHDRLDPGESARILRAHVTDGVEMVLAHGMGHRIADFVREHHGTSRMRSLAAAASADGADADAFEYPGPAPQSAETALVMIADRLEATARSAPPADEDECDAVVRTTLARVLDEGQLSESGLGRDDLERLRPVFLRVLWGMHHHRIAYPEPGATAPSHGFRLFRGRRGSVGH